MQTTEGLDQKPSFKMGRIFSRKQLDRAAKEGGNVTEGGLRKITLRKNSARRILASDKAPQRVVLRPNNN